VTAASDKDHLVDGILSLADQLFRLLLPTVPRDLLSLEITMPQLKILLILFVTGPRRMSDLAAELDVTLPTATSMVDRLVEKGFVARETQPSDRRVVLCHLAAAGEGAVSRIWHAARQRSRLLLQTMDRANLEMFATALQSMLDTASTAQMAAARD